MMNIARNYKYAALLLLVIVIWFAWPCLKRYLMPSCEKPSEPSSSSKPSSSSVIKSSATESSDDSMSNGDEDEDEPVIEATFKDVKDNAIYEEVEEKST